MTSPTTENQAEQPQPSNKELNFRQLEAKYERQLAHERAEREKLAHELQQRQQQPHASDDDEDDEPYVDKKKLTKTLAKFGQGVKQETQTEIQRAVHTALQEERKQNWLKNNGDFYDVLQHAEKFAQHDPELAESILTMPEGFERQKLVYKNIKALGLHREAPKTPSIQEKIDANRRSPYYQPSGVGAAPYGGGGDFSSGGQKQAYEKMQQLKQQLRI